MTGRRYPALAGSPDLPALEREVLDRWRERDVFARSVAQREGGRAWVFYEGPPTANGRPGAHHVLSRAFKDLFPRYHTMRGSWVPRVAGWDCHGLPVEIEVQRRLGIESKAEIEAMGIAAFNERCRESVLEYVDEWERFSDRMGFWADHRRAYRTMDDSYIESVWWSLHELWKRDLLYRGDKVVPYCPRDGTALSSHEVSLGYRDVDDPSVYVRFPLAERPGVALAVWTTTPWTLPANVAVALGRDVEYVEAETADGERLIVAAALRESALGEGSRAIAPVAVDDLLGLHYAPPFPYLDHRSLHPESDPYRVVAAGHVTIDAGTGLVHMAPAFGAEDMDVARFHDLPVENPVDPRGRFDERLGDHAGQFVKDADAGLIAELADRGRLIRAEVLHHPYPHCWRCGTPLLYYATPTWYVRTTAEKDRLLAANARVDWRPEHIRTGRFGEWLENNVDWALSRARYWGTPLPIWRCEGCGVDECVSSRAALAERAVEGPEVATVELHRPYVDDITLACRDCGATMTRYPEVIDVWYDSGCMPFAQFRYPFAAPERWQDGYPADFICEAVDQTRGWFYSLLAVNTLVFREGPYRHVLCLGHILDAEGRKMSKSVGNTLDPWTVFDSRGADAFRLYLYGAQQVGPAYRFSVEAVDEVISKVLRTWWSTAAFFCLYANIDGWAPTAEDPLPGERPALDRWLLAEMHALAGDVTAALDDYDAFAAARRLAGFVDLLSNWYVRRARRRFWRGPVDADKRAGYATLFDALRLLCRLYAPMTPFTADAVHEAVVRPADPGAPDSVHLDDWPFAPAGWAEPSLRDEMAVVRQVVSLGHTGRAANRLKVRQPLARVVVVATGAPAAALARHAELIADELNVKSVEVVADAGELMTYSVKPNYRTLGPRFGARMPEVAAAVAALDPEAVIRGEVTELLGETIDPEADFDVRVEPREGFAVARDAAAAVALDTRLTPELVREGHARELIHAIQSARKSAGLAVEDRVAVLRIAGAPELEAAARAHVTQIAAEALADDVVVGGDVDAEPVTVDGLAVRLSVG